MTFLVMYCLSPLVGHETFLAHTREHFARIVKELLFFPTISLGIVVFPPDLGITTYPIGIVGLSPAPSSRAHDESRTGDLIDGSRA